MVTALHSAYFEVGRRRRRDQHLRRLRRPARRVRHRRAGPRDRHGQRPLAREVADDFSTPDRHRFVAGSIGPGTKFASARPDPLRRPARRLRGRRPPGLLEGGVDLFIIETQFDLLGLKAAVIGARRAMADGRPRGPDPGAGHHRAHRPHAARHRDRRRAGRHRPAEVDIIGINCATGPTEMSEHLRHLSQHARMPISCLPNAGLPSVVDGKMHYDLTPEQLRDHHARFVTELGVQVIGGCCGTTPEYIQLLAEMAPNLTPRRAHAGARAAAPRRSTRSSPFEQDTSFLMIGERTNANGSKKFREAMLEGDWDTCHEDGQRPGEGGRPRPRRLRRLRRPRRHRRHGRDRQPLRHPGQRARWCSTRPSPR